MTLRYESMLSMGNGEHSSARCYDLISRLVEAFTDMGGLQQGIPTDDPAWERRIERNDRLVRDLAVSLTGDRWAPVEAPNNYVQNRYKYLNDPAFAMGIDDMAMASVRGLTFVGTSPMELWNIAKEFWLHGIVYLVRHKDRFLALAPEAVVQEDGCWYLRSLLLNDPTLQVVLQLQAMSVVTMPDGGFALALNGRNVHVLKNPDDKDTSPTLFRQALRSLIPSCCIDTPVEP